MFSLLIAFSEAAPPGDDWARAAYVLLLVAMVIAFAASFAVTPRRSGHH